VRITKETWGHGRPAAGRPRGRAIAGLCAAALAIGAAATATGTVITVSSPAGVSFTNLTIGDTASQAAAVSVIMDNSGSTEKYDLSVTRTVFTNGDIPLRLRGVSSPSDTSLDAAVTGATGAAIPIGSTLRVGGRTKKDKNVTDTWNISLILGPVPFIQDGPHVSTLTFTTAVVS
jgi:hypothetical protein